jgi:hypothetical protein
MAGNAGTYIQTARINWLLGTAYIAAPATTYVALFTVAPANDGTGGTEVSGGAYGRQSVASSGWAAASGASPTQTSNNGVISFGVATASWGTIVAWALYDAATGGHLIYTSNLTVSKTIGANDSFSFAIGSLVVEED